MGRAIDKKPFSRSRSDVHGTLRAWVAWYTLRERRCHDQWEGDRGLCVHLHAVAVHLDLAPADRLVRSCTRVASVELLGRVDVHGALCAVAHQVGIRNVMLDDATAQYDHPRPLGPHGNGVDLADVLYKIYPKLLGRGLERVKVQHVPEAAVRQRGAEDGYVVLPSPVVHRLLVVDLFTEAVDHLARRPMHGLV